MAAEIIIICEGVSDVKFLRQVVKANNLQANIAVKEVGKGERGITCIGKQLEVSCLRWKWTSAPVGLA